VSGQGIVPEIGKRAQPINFKIDPSTLESNSTSSSTLPKFLFEGIVFSTNCGITDPFDGMIVVRESELVIKSIESQLI
jgi:hypothetical protein